MTDIAMSDLLPCPFCGGEAGKIVDATRILGTFNLIHRCPIIGGVEIKRATREGVIARWNTRTPSQAQIDAAVKAERERCAKTAEAHGVYPELNVWNGGPEWYRHGQAIAAAIRKGRADAS